MKLYPSVWVLSGNDKSPTSNMKMENHLDGNSRLSNQKNQQ